MSCKSGEWERVRVGLINDLNKLLGVKERVTSVKKEETFSVKIKTDKPYQMERVKYD